MVIAPFDVPRLPKLVFGAGLLARLPELVRGFGDKALLVTGSRSLTSSRRLDAILAGLKAASIEVHHASVSGEPAPAFVDATAAQFRGQGVSVVVAVGGGSAVDAGKAVSAMLAEDGSVVEYLEGVGKRKPSGSKVPFIAVPTTAGTGSEATKNAVLSRVGPDGFKRSLRHDRYVPDAALIDPELALTCPPDVSGACGVDAFTQLLEAYVCVRANPFTDSLALGAMALVRDHLLPACTGQDLKARSAMAYAAYASGVCLANAGLGVIHGLAGTIGGWYPIPHGVICAALATRAIAANIKALRACGDQGRPALTKYAGVGALLAGSDPNDLEVSTLKENPVKLDQEALRGILVSRIVE
ncbi:MAG: iron-containing alcohol dehydrogenase [Elusimicrobia bacterium]|nr:iron-containing alcohol dehydrogenase [Elusimicrobiota bacterium]